MADAEHSKCFVRKDVWVQVPHPAQTLELVGVSRGGTCVRIAHPVNAQVVR